MNAPATTDYRPGDLETRTLASGALESAAKILAAIEAHHNRTAPEGN